MTELTKITLDTLLGGAAVERFDHELVKVLKNIQDLNTPAEKPRSITLTVTIHPDEKRYGGQLELSTSCKLAALKPVKGPLWFAEDGGGLVAAGFDPGQKNLFPDAQDPSITPIQRSAEK